MIDIDISDVVNIIILIMGILLGLTLINLVLVTHTNDYNIYADAPPCNETPGETCKISNTTIGGFEETTLLVCKKPYKLEADEHLRNVVWCEIVELYKKGD